MEGLSPATWEKVQQVFSPEQQAEASRILVSECGNTLPFCQGKDEYGLERVRLRFVTGLALPKSIGEMYSWQQGSDIQPRHIKKALEHLMF